MKNMLNMFILYFTTFLLFNSFALYGMDKGDKDKLIPRQSNSRVLIGDGASIIIDQEQSARILFDNLLISSGGVLKELTDEFDLSLLTKSNKSTSNLASTSIPSEFDISKAFPNPFNPTVNINYGLPIHSDVRILIHDLSGRKIAEFIQNGKEAGWHEFKWDALDQQGNSIGSGVYLLTIHAGDMVKKQKLTFIK